MTKIFWDWKAHFNGESVSDVFDCMIAEFLLLEGRSLRSEAETLSKYEVTTLNELAEKQQAKLSSLPQLAEYFTTIEMTIIPVLQQMEQNGILLDADRLQQVGQEIDQAVTELTHEMQKEVGAEMNLNSATQVGNFLAEKLGVPLKKTKTGKYATNEAEVSQYAEQFPFIQKLLQYRELTKLRSTYIETLADRVSGDGRVHTTYSQVTAATGRLASLNPNLQNIPASSGLGQKIKSCFRADEGCVLLSFDYSQQELRILAHLSHEESLIQAFQAQHDVHTSTAAQIFQVKYEEVTREQRMIAKTINFGVIYGMSSFGMSTQLHIPVSDAQTFINSFYKTYPNIRKYYDQYLDQGKKLGYVETILGRRRSVFEHDGQKFIDNAMRRVLMNYPIQGSAADLMKKAMIMVHQEVLSKFPECQLLLQIHDDLVFEVKDDPSLIHDFVAQVKNVMCHVYPLSVPIEVDVKVGKRWGEMKTLSQ